ncbi:MAG: 1-acyl-sn-glycerol-3-phosphate acyltransferase [Shimia sp.]
MTTPVTLPLWLFILIVLLAAIAFASNFLFPSVRWFFRRRAERVVKRLNERLARPIQPFKLARRYDTIQRVLYHPDVTRAVQEHAKRTGLREDVAFEKAADYAREIVPSFSAFTYYSLGTRGARWLSRLLYRVRLGYYDKALSDVDPEATVVFVMNHRSNMDYVLVTYLSAEQSALSYAVGEWARVWPLSRLIKMMGAYFIRRKSRTPLYRRVLARYVELATGEGVTQAIFPEGGLSLDGRLAPPKVGLLRYVIDGALEAGRPVVFIPVALNYDRILEDRVLIEAGQTGERRFRAGPGSIAAFMWRQSKRILTRRWFKFGYAAVSFGAPVPVSELPADVEEAAEVLMTRIAAVVPVVPVPLVCHALQAGARTQEAIEAHAQTFIADHPTAHVHLPRDSVTYAVEVGLRMLTLRRAIDAAFEPQMPDLIAFYANSISHLQKKEGAPLPQGEFTAT